MAIVAILVDGGFYQKRAQYLWHDAAPEERANELCAYCKRRIHQHDHLYRNFFYDCPPSDKKVFHPLTQQQVDLGRSEMYAWMTSFQKEMKKKRKVALRLGRLQDTELYYTLKPQTVKKLCGHRMSIDELNENEFVLNIIQKGVDMKIGVDIASMAYKKQVNKMILIAGDSDFVPAAKLARREGIDFVLDPMGAGIHEELSEHIDGLVSPHFVPKREEIQEAALTIDKEEESNM